MRLYGHLMALQKIMIKIEPEYPYKFLLKPTASNFFPSYDRRTVR